MHTKETIKQLLNESDKAVERGLVVLLSRQTADERVNETTRYQNGVGFSAFDAEILTSFAQQIERKTARGIELGKCLSEKQMTLARKKIVRYAGQLAEEANSRPLSASGGRSGGDGAKVGVCQPVQHQLMSVPVEVEYEIQWDGSLAVALPPDEFSQRVYWKEQENRRDRENDAKAAAFEAARDRIANFVNR